MFRHPILDAQGSSTVPKQAPGKGTTCTLVSVNKYISHASAKGKKAGPPESRFHGERELLTRRWRVKKGLKITVPGRLGDQRELEPSGETQRVSQARV